MRRIWKYMMKCHEEKITGVLITGSAQHWMYVESIGYTDHMLGISNDASEGSRSTKFTTVSPLQNYACPG
jgi:hypothetical protein